MEDFAEVAPFWEIRKLPVLRRITCWPSIEDCSDASGGIVQRKSACSTIDGNGL